MKPGLAAGAWPRRSLDDQRRVILKTDKANHGPQSIMNAEAHIEHDDHRDIRQAVAKLCEQYPGEYWRKLDREMAYPTEFVSALTHSGYLAVLIPE